MRCWKGEARVRGISSDGCQTKSYLYIDDCIDAILQATDKADDVANVFNVGSHDQITVKEIANLVIDEMALNNVAFKFIRGINGGRGWRGDVKKMLLDVKKLKSLGWSNAYGSADAIKQTVRSLLNRANTAQ